MRNYFINYVKEHPAIAGFIWSLARFILRLFSLFIRVDQRAIIFSSFGGRNFDDSPRALYDKIRSMKEFDGWALTWAFLDPEKFEIPRGNKVKIDTFSFFKALLTSRVWIGNSEIDRGIKIRSKKYIVVETWHGTPLKKICGEEIQTSVEKVKSIGKRDNLTIRCSQSEFDKTIFARIFYAEYDMILDSDLPRNDSLLAYTNLEKESIKEKLGITSDRKVILYTPTYREYLINEHRENFIVPPIDFNKWKDLFGKNYVFLLRAHYMVSSAFDLGNTDFVIDVSKYPRLNDLYIISDLMISDYSSTFFDYSILDRPMLCFAYDLEEYSTKRGLYLDLEKELPCRIDQTEEQLIDSILTLDYHKACKETKSFHMKYAPYSGKSCEIVVNAILDKLKK